MNKLPKSYRLTVNRGIAQADGILYLHFKYRGIPFTLVYRASQGYTSINFERQEKDIKFRQNKHKKIESTK
jgi:hypothetical protein